MSNGRIDFVEPAAQGEVPLEQVAIRLQPQDDVAIAKENLQPGTILLVNQGAQALRIAVAGFIPTGHKVALRMLAAGQPVRRYGQIIGFASQDIQPGQHIHTHNLDIQDFSRDYDFGREARPVELVPIEDRRTFQGYRRVNGQVGTRNYIAVISTVNCSAHTCREIAHHFTPARLAAYPNIDGVIALTHTTSPRCALKFSPHALA